MQQLRLREHWALRASELRLIVVRQYHMLKHYGLFFAYAELICKLIYHLYALRDMAEQLAFHGISR